MEMKRLLLLLYWFIGIENMSSGKAIFSSVLLPLQLCLGLWQIAKLTPVWAVMRCIVSRLMMILFPCLSGDFNRLKNIDGRIFKNVICYVTTPVLDLAPAPAKEKADEHSHQYRVQVKYLDQDFILERKLEEKFETRVQVNGKDSVEGEKLYMDNLILERKEGAKLFLNDVPKYYITDEIWHSIFGVKEVCDIKEVADKELRAKKKEAVKTAVFIKNYKEIWEEVVTGRVMSLEEVLDSVVLDNQMFSRLDHEYFLPIDLTLSEEKILKVLNLVGLFLQSQNQKHVHWLAPALLSLTSAVMGFSTQLRRFVYGKINMLCCIPIHLLCNQLSFPRRRRAYSLGNWIDNLKPSNDLQSKILRGEIRALIAGGAKVENKFHGATLLDVEGAQMLDIHHATLSDGEFKFNQGKNQVKRSFECGTFDIDCEFQTENDSIEGGAEYNGKCKLKAGEIATVAVDCNSEEAQKLFKFAYHMADTKSGSLKSYDPDTKTVHVRRFRESVIAYVRSGYPPLYELKLDNVVVR